MLLEGFKDTEAGRKEAVQKLASMGYGAPSIVLRQVSNGTPLKASAQATEDNEPPIVLPKWPDPPNPEAYYGLGGEIVRALEPHTEADPIAILMQLYVAFGNLIGRSPYARVGRAYHHTNEFLLVIGETSEGRKGTAWTEAECVLSNIDPSWSCRSGLASGEGIIANVRDPLEGKEPIKEKGKITGYQDVILDHGVADKRLMIVEPEFSRPLQVMRREGTTLSAVIRQAFDSGNLCCLTKFPYKASKAHVSIIGHATPGELRNLLSAIDLTNGFANRFLWCMARRTQLLPFGGTLDDNVLKGFQEKLREIVERASGIGYVGWRNESRSLWETAYPGLTAQRKGAIGTVASRGTAHALRLATMIALFNGYGHIELECLRAALALGAYSERSAAYILGNRLDDRDEEAILSYIKSVANGASRSDIRRSVFNDHRPASFVADKIASLLSQRLVRCETLKTEGRPKELWFSPEEVREKRERREKPLGGSDAPLFTPFSRPSHAGDGEATAIALDNHKSLIDNALTPRAETEDTPFHAFHAFHAGDGEKGYSDAALSRNELREKCVESPSHDPEDGLERGDL
jgi:hypothetical protein